MEEGMSEAAAATTLPAVQQKLGTVRRMLEQMRPQMLMVLGNPTHVSSIVRVAMTEIQRNPVLLDCSATSLMGAVMMSCQLGIEPDGVRCLAHLVPFGKQCQLIPGYRGLLFLARQTEGVHDIYAHLVHEKDEFREEQGSEPVLIHVPHHGADRGKVICGYYMIVFTNGMRRFATMDRDEMDKVKKQALENKRNKDNPDLPWNKWEDEMQKKTLLRRASKTLPQNSRLAHASALSEMADAGIPQNLDILADPNAVAETQPSDDRTAEPAKAPRKSKPAPVKETAGSTGQTPTVGPASAPTPSADTGELFQTKLPVAMLDKLVDTMSRLDAWQGERVSLRLMGERYQGIDRVSQLTEEQGKDFLHWMGLQMGDES